VLLTSFCIGAPAHAVDLNQRINFEIPAQKLSSALIQFSQQAKLQVVVSDNLGEQSSPALSGSHAIGEALETLLSASGLIYRVISDTSITVGYRSADAATSSASPRPPLRLAQGDADARSNQAAPDASSGAVGRSSTRAESLEEHRLNLPEVLVTGAKTLNMDIPRTRDDAQPYVIIERSTIENSGARNLEDFLKKRLTMNTHANSNGQNISSLGDTSQVNLRGLGTNQTLILIDGHRTAGLSNAGTPLQPDLNGIPLAAVERIEVLPTTASGIHGGSATGGVVNIVLRRDYSGAEVKLSYDNTFDAGSALQQVDFNTGFTLEGGKTWLLAAGSLIDNEGLLNHDRDFYARGRAALRANNPAVLLPPTAPPLGATTNIRSQNGSPLFGPGSPSFTSVPAGYAGGGGLAPLQSNAGSYNYDLAQSAQLNGDLQGLLMSSYTKSLMLTARRELSPNVQAFLELAGSDSSSRFQRSGLAFTFNVGAAAPNNPFGQAIQATVPLANADDRIFSTKEERRVVGGVIVKLPGEWKSEADFTWGTTRRVTAPQPTLSAEATAAIFNGALDVLRDTTAFPLDLEDLLVPSSYTALPFRSRLKDITLRAGGPVGRLPAGAPVLSLAVEKLDEFIPDARQGGGSSPYYYPSRSQSAKSAYAELRVPFISAVNALPGVRELDMQIAVRRDEYTVEGVTGFVSVLAPTPIVRATSRTASTNPTLGVRYHPVRDVMLRASYGTGFLPPTVNQLVPSPPATGTSAFDPLRGNQLVSFLTVTGGTTDLQPEKSTSWSAGMVLTPHFVPNLRVSLDYTRIEKRDNIVSLTAQQTIDNESIAPDRVIRGPRLPDDPADWAGPITVIDRTNMNRAWAEVEAFDLTADYARDTESFGRFELYALATWQTHYETQLLPTEPVVENVGVSSDNPLKFKANAGALWKFNHWSAGWNGRYFDSYVVSRNAATILNQGTSRVPSQHYHDAFVGYRFEAPSRLLDGLELQAGVKNIFNAKPPLDMGNTFFFYSLFGDPRLSSYYISLKQQF